MPTQPLQHDLPRVPSSPCCRGPWRNADEKSREQEPKTLESLQIKKKKCSTPNHIFVSKHFTIILKGAMVLQSVIHECLMDQCHSMQTPFAIHIKYHLRNITFSYPLCLCKIIQIAIVLQLFCHYHRK